MISTSAILQTQKPNSSNLACISSFRKYHDSSHITIVTEQICNFSEYEEKYNVEVVNSNIKCDPRGRLNFLTLREYLKRIYQHCIKTQEEFTVILEDDVMTYKPISKRPLTSCAGPRINPYQEGLIRFLQEKFNSKNFYGYGMSGGSIFKTEDFINSYEKNIDFEFFSLKDSRIPYYSDVSLTLLFQLSGYEYSEWEDVSEKFHKDINQRIYRDSALDHNDKRLYEQ
jgi:hypothetical protein